MTQPFDLVIFDCDGVLVDSEPLAALAIQSVLCEAGIVVSLEAIGRCVGLKQADILARLEAETGAAIGPHLAAALWPATRRLFAERLAATAGIEAMLAGLPYPSCVASSSSHERIAFSLSVTRLDRFFPPGAVFSGSEVAHGKPAPDLFLHAASRMGAVPHRCVVIEDSPYGVTAAVAAGMTPIGFVGGSHATQASATLLRSREARWVEHSWADVAGRLGFAL